MTQCLADYVALDRRLWCTDEEPHNVHDEPATAAEQSVALDNVDRGGGDSGVATNLSAGNEHQAQDQTQHLEDVQVAASEGAKQTTSESSLHFTI
eukprot:COSAG01_NODE_4172_length_5271_cov_19.601121_4_plen_95_part_00